jgi:hypothetical protein
VLQAYLLNRAQLRNSHRGERNEKSNFGDGWLGHAYPAGVDGARYPPLSPDQIHVGRPFKEAGRLLTTEERPGHPRSRAFSVKRDCAPGSTSQSPSHSRHLARWTSIAARASSTRHAISCGIPAPARITASRDAARNRTANWPPTLQNRASLSTVTVSLTFTNPLSDMPGNHWAPLQAIFQPDFCKNLLVGQKLACNLCISWPKISLNPLNYK